MLITAHVHSLIELSFNRICNAKMLNITLVCTSNLRVYKNFVTLGPRLGSVCDSHRVTSIYPSLLRGDEIGTGRAQCPVVLR